MTGLQSGGAKRWIATIDFILEAVYVIGSDGATLATVVTLKHDAGAELYARALRKAAIWFEQRAKENES